MNEHARVVRMNLILYEGTIHDMWKEKGDIDWNNKINDTKVQQNMEANNL